jgi:hypothetical protein
LSLKELEGLLETYSPMMDGPTERVVDKAIKYGTAFAEVSPPIWRLSSVDTLQLNPIAKAVFGLASVTFEVCTFH